MSDHSASTGSWFDFYLLGFAWLMALSPDKIPAVLSAIASICVIVNQIHIYLNRKNNVRKTK